MKVMIAYPPLDASRGVPLLSQNRQFQYFNEPTYIYPVVPASAATLLKEAGHEVVWLDGIAEGLTYPQFLERVKAERPDLIAIETKTPVVKKHWEIVKDLNRLSTIDYRLSTVIFGDHVTALPQESMENSPVDFVITGGDYDFLLRNLCSCFSLEHGAWSMERLEPGIWYRDNGTVKNSGVFKLDHDLDLLPTIDRRLTRWELYAYKNGNFRKTPGAYTMAGRDCWWGRCSFCSWPTLYPKFRVRSVPRVIDEIEGLVSLGVKEVMDDTGSFPAGDWLTEFCDGMVARGLDRRVTLDCNMRFGALSPEAYHRMKAAGFRLVLFGLESANQATLDRIDKRLKIDEIVSSCRAAREAGLFPHITIMFGYPWETREDAQRTLDLGCYLLRKGFAYTVQATIVIPYPGTRLFEECKKEGMLLTEDWDAYDMKSPVMKTNLSDQDIREFVTGIYGVAFNPEFILRRLAGARSMDDWAYFGRGVKKVWGHLTDFKGEGCRSCRS